MAAPAQNPILPVDDIAVSPALPSSIASQDPAHSIPFNTNALPRSSLSCRTHGSGKPPSRSISILGKIPKDLSSFLHTGSLSRQSGRLFQEATSKLGHSGYADLPEPVSKPERAHLRNMFSTPTGAVDERPARKLKKENKFYNFLTRSRSRSKTDRSPPPNHDPLPDVPRNGHGKESSGSKPPYRIPSRPISSTTTATDSTVTPGTLKTKKKQQSSIPVPVVTRPNDTTSKTNKPQPNAPDQPITSRRTLNIFGISIPGRRRPSFSPSESKSLPETPRASLDIPPLPTFGFEEDSRGPQSSSRPGSPSFLGIHQDTAAPFPLDSVAGHDPPTQATETNTDFHAGSPKLRGFLSGRDSSRSQDRNSTGVAASLVSAPLKRVSSNQRHSIKSTTDRPTSSSAPRASSPTSNIPRIMHTPATPIRAATVSGGTAKTVVASTSRSGHLVKGRSLDNGYRYRGAMDVVDEEGRLSREVVTPQPSSKGKGKNLEGPQSRVSLSRMSTSMRNTKHGSFDFERPGLGAIAMQRTGSGGTTSTGWSRNGESNVARESAFGPGLAGVGTVLQRDVSIKRGKEREEKGKEIEKQVKEAVKTVVVEQPEPSPKPNHSPGHSSHDHHTPPSGTTSGKSSSMSKASGKRFFGKGLPGTRGTTQHGLFSFEPPVPSPTWSTASAGTSKEVSTLRAGKSEKQKVQPPKEKERPVERKLTQRRDRSPVPVPLPDTRRLGGKGRSLDLNLGLSWAPSKVREDVLLSSSNLFNRSISTSSSARSVSGSRSANSSAHGHDRASSQSGDTLTVEKSKIARETAEMFRKALGEARYTRFKTYIYQFDGQEIPFDGPTGIISKVDGLLATVPTLGFDEKRRLMDKLVRIILQNA